MSKIRKEDLIRIEKRLDRTFGLTKPHLGEQRDIYAPSHKPPTLIKGETMTTASASLQWEGTDACADILCICGATGHFDGYFMYNLECYECHRVYDVLSDIVLKPTESKKDGYKYALFGENENHEVMVRNLLTDEIEIENAKRGFTHG